MTKPGWKTTEFYLAISGIGVIVWQFGQAHCQVTTTDVLAIGGIVIAYIINRGWLKA